MQRISLLYILMLYIRFHTHLAVYDVTEKDIQGKENICEQKSNRNP